jgi:uncharacterized membrane protein YfcA
MGMGGGTLTVPLLALCMGVAQHAAQGVNLAAFIPMSVIALIIHLKNKLIQKDIILPMTAPALLSAAGGALLSLNTDAGALRKYFGIFLITLGIVHLVPKIIFSIICLLRK